MHRLLIVLAAIALFAGAAAAQQASLSEEARFLARHARPWLGP